MIQIKTTGKSRKVIFKINNITQDMRKGIRQGFYFSGKKIISDLRKDFLRKPRAGRTYFLRKIKGGRRFKHVASVPGETPANFTGKLRKSSNFLVRGHTQMDVGYEDVDYAPALEFGSKNIKPRPGIKIWINRNERDIEKFMNREIKKALK
ncbi:MAG: hypothetical protein JSU91_01890 [Thermoplasmatales archaeon]|nr:MAG: hypothetical protein JSU91_01890 [Thermoplasmatales archaeon]